jgi:hypothetical protein
MTFKLNCKIVEISRLKNPELLSVKVFETYNVELMCHAHSSHYDALYQNKGKWVDLIIRPSSIILYSPDTGRSYTNRFHIKEVKTSKINSDFMPRMDW